MVGVFMVVFRVDVVGGFVGGFGSGGYICSGGVGGCVGSGLFWFFQNWYCFCNIKVNCIFFVFCVFLCWFMFFIQIFF